MTSPTLAKTVYWSEEKTQFGWRSQSHGKLIMNFSERQLQFPVSESEELFQYIELYLFLISYLHNKVFFIEQHSRDANVCCLLQWI